MPESETNLPDPVAHARRAVALSRSLPVMLLLVLLAVILSFALGRQGERIAAQLCVNVAAILALATFSGNSGIVSFGHAAFMAVGAYLSGLLTMPAALQGSVLPQLPAFLAGHEWPLAASLAAVALFGLALGWLSGLPLARLSGPSATIATLGLLIIVHSVLIGARDITRGSQTFYGVPRVTDLALALGAACAFVLIASLYRESRFGLALRATRDDETAARAVGVAPRRARLIGWALSGAMAAVAGALYGHLLGAFSPRDFYFALTFTLVAMLIVGGMSTVAGAVTGVVVVTLLQDGVRQIEGGFTLGPLTAPPVFGLSTAALAIVILLVLWRRPDGLLGTRAPEWRALTRLLDRLAPSASPAPTASAASSTATAEASRKTVDRTGRSAVIGSDVKSGKGDGHGIDVRDLSKRFGGLAAVDAASFAAPGGTITALIGPNGAGKSTVVNLLTGQFRPDEGEIHFGGLDLSRAPPHELARAGLARTFQNIRIFEQLSAFENVLVAALSSGATSREARVRSLAALERLDLAARGDRLAATLPYGERKRLEIARCLALRPAFVLLDEPAAGLNPEETIDLGRRLSALAADDGTGMLLIDHDLDFVNRLSTSVVVMDRGAVIATGTPRRDRCRSARRRGLSRPRAQRTPDPATPVTTTAPMTTGRSCRHRPDSSPARFRSALLAPGSSTTATRQPTTAPRTTDHGSHRFPLRPRPERARHRPARAGRQRPGRGILHRRDQRPVGLPRPLRSAGARRLPLLCGRDERERRAGRRDPDTHRGQGHPLRHRRDDQGGAGVRR